MFGLCLNVSWRYFYYFAIKCNYCPRIGEIYASTFEYLRIYSLFSIIYFLFSFFVLSICNGFRSLGFNCLLDVINFFWSLVALLLSVVLLLYILGVQILLLGFAAYLKLLFRRKGFAFAICLRLIFTLPIILYSNRILTPYFFQCAR